jgi:hypothetical protein
MRKKPKIPLHDHRSFAPSDLFPRIYFTQGIYTRQQAFGYKAKISDLLNPLNHIRNVILAKPEGILAIFAHQVDHILIFLCGDVAGDRMIGLEN